MAFNNPPWTYRRGTLATNTLPVKGIAGMQACLHYHNTLDYIYDKINMIEKELDILLRML
ncbi:hypothetical protein NXV90_05745 [Bacteroides ovatus]|nr:hypothetical protein [Bacteroides ovatus]